MASDLGALLIIIMFFLAVLIILSYLFLKDIDYSNNTDDMRFYPFLFYDHIGYPFEVFYPFDCYIPLDTIPEHQNQDEIKEEPIEDDTQTR